jgi:transposase
MNTVAIVAIDLGKLSFHIHAQDDHGRELYHRKFNRETLIRHLASLAPCTVVMEACGGSHFMAREVTRLGHTPKLIPAQFVRPYVKSNKNDFADAAAIGEAATRDQMRFVQPKTEAQQALAMLNSLRDSFIKDRTATMNRIHAYLLEVGSVCRPASKRSVNSPSCWTTAHSHR